MQYLRRSLRCVNVGIEKIVDEFLIFIAQTENKPIHAERSAGSHETPFGNVSESSSFIAAQDHGGRRRCREALGMLYIGFSYAEKTVYRNVSIDCQLYYTT